MATIQNKIKPKQLKTNGGDYLKMALLELAVLNKNTSLLDKLFKNENNNAKKLMSNFKKFFNGEVIETSEAKQLYTQLKNFMQDISDSNELSNSKLEQLDLKLLTLINQGRDNETDEKIMLKAMQNIDRQLESNKMSQDIFNRTLATILHKKQNDEKNSSSNKNPESKNSGLFTGILTGGLGLGSLLLTALGIKGGVKGLVKTLALSTKNKITDKIKTSSIKDKVMNGTKKLKLGSAKPNLNFVDKTSKLSKLGEIGKGFGNKILNFGKNALKIGKLAGPLGRALTIVDLAANAYTEFFGEGSEKKSMYEKIRNTFTKTLSDFFFGLIDYKTVNTAIDSISEFITNIGSKIGKTIGDITNSIYNGLKSMLPEFIRKYLPDVHSNSSNNQVMGPPSPPQRTTQIENREASQGFWDKLVNKPTQFFKDGIKGTYNALTGQPITQGIDVNSENSNEPRSGVIGKPLDKMIKTSNFGMRHHPTLGITRMHKGTDYGAAIGTPIKAPFDGEVVSTLTQTDKAGRISGAGHYTTLKHENGLVTKFFHQSKFLVKPGQKVKAGQVIGLTGNTGVGTAPHLHYETWVNGQPVDSTKLSQYWQPSNGKIGDKINDVPEPKYTSINKADKTKESGANSSSVISTPSSKITSGNFMEQAFKGIEKNESSNPTKLVKDPNKGFNFGKSQFNSAKNPDSWRKLGFSKQEISQINTGNFDKQVIQQRLEANKDTINKMDEDQKLNLAARANWQEQNLFNKQGFKIKDPRVKAQLMDINNQYGNNLLDSDSAQWMNKFSGNTGEINLEGVKGWRLNRGREGKIRPQDQMRRFNNINSAFTESAPINNIDNINKPVITKTKSIGLNNVGKTITKEKVVKAITKDNTSKIQSPQPTAQIMPMQIPNQQKPINNERTTSINNDDLLILNFGYIR